MKTIILFDVDGTLTECGKKIEEEMIQTIMKLKKKYTIGIVGGSDLKKQQEQLGISIKLFDYIFSENGTMAFKDNQCFHSQNMIDFLGEEKYSKLVNFCLRYIADLDLPKKRGTFIEMRNGMINVSPIGRNCSMEEREEFFLYDQKYSIRKKFVQAMESNLNDLGLKYSLGGQISIDIFPIGWDKTYCLRHLKDFDTIYFFGDRTEEGGNDYEIYSSDQTISYSVKSPNDTVKYVKELFLYKYK
jgi:phosphomannomutase